MQHAAACFPDARMSTVEFQAVVISGLSSDGDNLYPLTEDLPLGLLPVANRPLLSYQLELLARSQSFSQVLVLTIERWHDKLSTWVCEQYKGPLQIELLVVPDDAGSADSLRHIRDKLTKDFVLLAGDVISDVPFQRMADQHRLQGAAVTAVFRESAPREAGVAKKARDLDGIDFVGIDERGGRLLAIEAAADCSEHNAVPVSQSLLRSYPHVSLRTDLVDAHIYIFAHWVRAQPTAPPPSDASTHEEGPCPGRRTLASHPRSPHARSCATSLCWASSACRTVLAPPPSSVAIDLGQPSERTFHACVVRVSCVSCVCAFAPGADRRSRCST